ncbi:MAG: hypothetical protein K2G35_06825 [Duncaniella sp.]|nr:hypothetical protein [Duncaniella sp.]
MKKDRLIKAAYGVEWYADGTVLLLRCPKCDRENYALNVALGVCTWCGYRAPSRPPKSKSK